MYMRLKMVKELTSYQKQFELPSNNDEIQSAVSVRGYFLLAVDSEFEPSLRLTGLYYTSLLIDGSSHAATADTRQHGGHMRSAG